MCRGERGGGGKWGGEEVQSELCMAIDPGSPKGGAGGGGGGLFATRKHRQACLIRVNTRIYGAEDVKTRNLSGVVSYVFERASSTSAVWSN